jgi:glutathione synthase/RimK-type ligase-like ATP-grasp enzyme
LKGWESFDVEKIAAAVKQRGYPVRIVGVSDLWRLKAAELRGAVVYAATSMFGQYRVAFEAVVHRAEQLGAITLPRWEHYLSYENKVFAASIAESKEVRMPAHCLVSSLTEVNEAMRYCGVPNVWKLPYGCASRNVRLVQDDKQANRLARRWLGSPVWGNGANPSVASRICNRFFGFYSGRGSGTILVESLVSSPGYDWKVLVWNEKANALKRINRKNDFRASGSGVFLRQACSEQVLELAHESCRKLGLRWGSFDIVEGKHAPIVVEWQAVHFGTLTSDKADSFYQRTSTGWKEQNGRLSLEGEIAGALIDELGEAATI